MKSFFLSGTILFIVLILIIAFQNIASVCGGFWILFISLDQQTSATFIVLFLTAIGFITGIFVTALVGSILNAGKNEEEGGGANW